MFKNSNHGISTLVAIGIIAVLVVVVGGGILGYQYISSQKNNNQQQNQNQQQAPNNQTNNTQPSITVLAPAGGEVLAENSKVVGSLSSVDSQNQIFEIKWTGAPDTSANVYGDNAGNPSRIAAYLEQNVNGQFNTIGRIIPQSYGSIMWIVGEVSNINCINCMTGNGSCPSSTSSNSCYSSIRLVAPGTYNIKIVDTQTNAFGRSNNFTIVAPLSNTKPVPNIMSAPKTLGVGETGTWQIKINYPTYSTSNLSFYAIWGDEQTSTPSPVYVGPNNTSGADDAAKFYHIYNFAGTYYPTFIAVDKNNYTGRISSTVVVGSSTQPSITVTSPVGGETWKIGETHNITWIASGMSLNTNVCISFEDHNFGRLVSSNTIACVPSLQGSYSWTISALIQEAQTTDNPTGKVSSVGSQWKVNIVCDGNQNNKCGWVEYGFGQSANYFSIVAPN